MESMDIIDSYIQDITIDKSAVDYQYVCKSCRRMFYTKIQFTKCHVCVAVHNTHHFNVINVPNYNRYIFICSCGLYHEINK
ncbi:Hypothetical protein PACV_352 [Pacmanvirus A23]|uniref:Hypothetical protein n=1 Tax=Pacmanvirus A23 TaxID=1932881 RepID=UPI000A094AB6|nr:Hypothetical protein B9W72_gp348 [Pacmanvirus A23]SIP86065.1 Hypothetical protein PACV_352 [Pacmanvirus A23]